MKITFITNGYYPKQGGVEKHAFKINSILNKTLKIRVITSTKDNLLRQEETVDNVKIIRFKPLHIKFLGLLHIWVRLFKNIKTIISSDIIHCHDVFIWYLPFKFLFPNKPVYVTFHGWEGKYPIPLKNRIIRKISEKLSDGNISVGKYLTKYYGTKPNIVIYGGVDLPNTKHVKKDRKLIIFLGRLEKETGVNSFIKKIKKLKGYKIEFVGDGSLRSMCEKYGIVHGYTDPRPYLKQAYICYSSGYLSAMEALAYKCILWIGWDSEIRKDIWEMSPFIKYANKKDVMPGYLWAKTQSWENIADLYLKLWKIKR